MVKIAINGLGRIGRSVLRAYYELHYKSKGLELVAVNSPSDIDQCVHLLKHDSVHGPFTCDIDYDDSTISIEGDAIHLFRIRDPKDIDWARYGVDIVFECSGLFNTRENAIKHHADKILVSAPVSDADKTVIYGVNHQNLQNSDKVISIGSCTTNCFAPIVDIIHKSIGINHGFMTTIHSYTNDQNVVDSSHKDWRRSRACALSMIPTSTGAAKAIGQVIPDLQGKIGGTSVRVPTPNVSLIDFTFVAKNNTSIDTINLLMKNAAQSHLKGILDTSEQPLVSIDFVHNPHSAVFDCLETRVIDNKFVRVLAWYDNEWAFSVRMLDIAHWLNK